MTDRYLTVCISSGLSQELVKRIAYNSSSFDNSVQYTPTRKIPLDTVHDLSHENGRTKNLLHCFSYKLRI